MRKIYIYPYSSGSESAKLLAERLGAKRIRLSNSTYEFDPDHVIINWGNTNCPYPSLNPGHLLKETVDKLSLFRLLSRTGHGTILPRYWTHPDDIPSDAFPVFCRTTTTGCDGAGIVIANDRSELVQAPLYTSRIGSGTEYRVTYFKGYGITDIQTKAPRQGVEQDPDIKTYTNGWGFQRLTVSTSTQDTLENLCEAVSTTTGLDFFGADVIVTPNGRPYVLEINSAMGLEGQALDRFATAVEAYVSSLPPLTPLEEEYCGVECGAEEPEPHRNNEIITAVNEGRWKDVIILAGGML